MTQANERDNLGGFGSPVFDAQAVFDGAMRALARPGSVHDLGNRIEHPRDLEPAAAALLAALADYDTPLWLDEPARVEAVKGWIAFQTGAVVMADPARARFAVVSRRARLPDLTSFALGSAEYPDRSTTLILAVDALEGGAPLILRGPGIETAARIAPRGLPETFLADWAINNALFPRGVDVFLVAGTRLLGLPRTTRIGGA